MNQHHNPLVDGKFPGSAPYMLPVRVVRLLLLDWLPRPQCNAIRLFHFSNQRNIRSPTIGNILKFAAEVSLHTKFGVEVPRLSMPRDFQMNAAASTTW